MGRTPLAGLLAAVTLAATLAGCAAIKRQEAKGTDDLLTAAGFQIKPADTPARAQELAAMPPLKMMRQTDGDKIIYTWADPYECQCLMVGGPKEYAEFKRLAIGQEIADENMEAAEAEEDAAMDWGLWGPWGPWY